MRQRLRVRLRLGPGWCRRRCGAPELRIDRLDALLPLPRSMTTRALRRVCVLELHTEDWDAPKDTSVTRCLAVTIMVEIAVSKLAKEGALYRRTSPPSCWMPTL